MTTLIIMLIAFLVAWATQAPTDELSRAVYLTGSIVMVLFIIILWAGKNKK